MVADFLAPECLGLSRTQTRPNASRDHDRPTEANSIEFLDYRRFFHVVSFDTHL
jgi:hypothetical protein